MHRIFALVLVVAAAAFLAAATAAAQDRRPYDVRLFARIGNPGQPEPIAVGPDGLVYVATNNLLRGDTCAPSRIFAFDDTGHLRREIVVRGQDLEREHGILGLAFDRDGTLYAVDRAPRARVIAIDLRTGAQRDYAVFRDVPPCPPGSAGPACSATVSDLPAAPNWAVFGRDGTMYATDIDQALIWRIPRGGPRAEVWLTDARFESLFGPNGISFLPDGRTLVMALTADNPQAGEATSGRLHAIPVQADGRPGPPRELWQSRPFDGPDGVAVGRSGRIYVALAGASQIAVVSPAGRELVRFPQTPLDNQRQEVPFDAPASLAFLGERLLVTNQSFPAGNPSHWAVLDVFAGETGLPLFRPRMRPAGEPGARRPRLRVAARARTGRAGRRTRFTFRVTRAGDRRAVRGATVWFAGRRLRTDRRGIARTTRTLRVAGHRYAVVARRRGHRLGRTTVRLRGGGARRASATSS